LLRVLNGLPGLAWLRLMYLHPHSVSLELVETVRRCDKVAPYFDLPIQHVADAVLKRMNRRDRGEDIRRTVGLLRREVPGAVLRTTVMVGFPGETEEDFAALYRYVAETGFDWLGAFVFEPQEGTPAAAFLPRVEPEVARERYERILALQRGIVREKNKNRLGRREKVLITGKRQSGLYVGRAYFQAPEVDGVILVKSNQALAAGQFAEVILKAVRDYDMIGELEDEYTE
jgi:ribosomal protein S12 methylthiotransferase